MATDPVCGMTVDPKTTARIATYEGQTYNFCAPSCKRAFEANPQPYLSGGAQAAP